MGYKYHLLTECSKYKSGGMLLTDDQDIYDPEQESHGYVVNQGGMMVFPSLIASSLPSTTAALKAKQGRKKVRFEEREDHDNHDSDSSDGDNDDLFSTGSAPSYNGGAIGETPFIIEDDSHRRHEAKNDFIRMIVFILIFIISALYSQSIVVYIKSMIGEKLGWIDYAMYATLVAVMFLLIVWAFDLEVPSLLD